MIVKITSDYNKGNSVEVIDTDQLLKEYVIWEFVEEGDTYSEVEEWVLTADGFFAINVEEDCIHYTDEDGLRITWKTINNLTELMK